ncbi:unnamed protein product [Brugia timori]|uniref:HECT domain-containing protein n=1 Tax=Brugia timori TaxID=42155 RepID=A0A0R3QF41_9BILA|nr:unnamed protein product [Brugia timori]
MLLEYFNCNNFIRPFFPCFDNLPKRTFTQKFQHLILISIGRDEHLIFDQLIFSFGAGLRTGARLIVELFVAIRFDSRLISW